MGGNEEPLTACEGPCGAWCTPTTQVLSRTTQRPHELHREQKSAKKNASCMICMLFSCSRVQPP